MEEDWNSLSAEEQDEVYKKEMVENLYEKVLKRYTNIGPTTKWFKTSDPNWKQYKERYYDKPNYDKIVKLGTKFYFKEEFENFDKKTIKLIKNTNTYKNLRKQLDDEDKAILDNVVSRFQDSGVKENREEIKQAILNKSTDLDVREIPGDAEERLAFYDELDHYENEAILTEDFGSELESVEEQVFEFPKEKNDLFAKFVLEGLSEKPPEENKAEYEEATEAEHNKIFETKVGFCYDLLDNKRHIPIDIDTMEEEYFAKMWKADAKFCETLRKRGHKEIVEWIRMCRNFIVCFSTTTFVHLRNLDLKLQVEEGQEFRILDEISKGMMSLKGMRDVGSEQWRFQIFEKRYQISLEIDFMRLRTICRNTGVRRPSKFKSLVSIAGNREEKVLFATLVGVWYTHFKKTKDLRIHESSQRTDENRIGESIAAYYTRVY